MKISPENVGGARNHGVDLNERFYELHPAPVTPLPRPPIKSFLSSREWKGEGKISHFTR